MTKKWFLHALVLCLMAAAVLSCAKKEEHSHDAGEHESADSSSEDWKEMDDFHMIMAETFHPYKDSANLEPVKTHAEHLAMEAEKWAAKTPPEKVNNDEVKAKLEKLKGDTRALADKVKASAPNEEIAAQLTAVHDLFHEIQESWYGGHGGDHH